MLSCEFCEISKNTFFTEQLGWLLLVITSNFLMSDGKKVFEAKHWLEYFRWENGINMKFHHPATRF